MPSISAQIAAKHRARLLAIANELAELDATKAGGLPDYKGPGGIGHVQYRMSLVEESERLARLLSSMGDPDLIEDGSGALVENRYVTGI